MNPADTVLWDSDIKSIAQIYNAPYYLTFGPDIAMFEVRDVYNRILGRQPTSTELSKYKARLLFNRVPSLRNYDSRTFVAEIAGLAEHRNRFGADTSLFIDSLYLKTLYVLPTKAAKDTCLNLMRAGVKADSVARYAVYSLAWAKTWVKAAYLQHMDAVLSTTTTSTLALKIVNGTQTPEETVYAWLKSAGYFALCDPQDNSGLITRLYTTLTGVAPTSSQLSFWMNWIN